MRFTSKLSLLALTLLALTWQGQALAQRLSFGPSDVPEPAVTSPLKAPITLTQPISIDNIDLGQEITLTLRSAPWLGPTYGTFRGNTVEVSGLTTDTDVIAGWYQGSQNVSDNELTVSSGNVHSALAAVNQGPTLTSYNTLNLAATTQASNAIAALGQGTVRANSLNLEGNATHAISGISLQGTAQSNDLWLGSAATSTIAIGGWGARAATQNEVITDAGSSGGTIIGGLSSAGYATDNSVSIAGSAKTVIGGYGQTEASSNFVDLMGSADVAVAAVSRADKAEFNTITQWSGTSKELYGAIAQGTTASNLVTLSAGATSEHLTGAISLAGDSIYNKVNVYGTVRGHNIALTGAQAPGGSAYLNEVNILPDASVSGDIVGAQAQGAAQYNEVMVQGKVSGNITVAQSHSAQADFNLLSISDTTVSGNLIVAQAPSRANDNTLLLNHANISGDAIAAHLTQATERAEHNIAILRGTTTVSGTVFGAQDSSGDGLDLHNEISVDGTVTVGGLDGFHRLHILLHPQNDSDISATAQHALTVTGSEGLDLRHKELWVSGLKVAAADQSKLIYVNSPNKLLVDETTLIRGDETFVFNAWVPKDEHTFEHELIWTDAGPVAPDEPSTPDNEPIFDHSTNLDSTNAQTLLVTPAAAALTVAQGATLLDDLVLPRTLNQVVPVMAGRAYDLELNAHGNLELEGYAALLGAAIPLYQGQDWSLHSVVLMELGDSDYSQDFSGIAPSGEVTVGGVGIMLSYAQLKQSMGQDAGLNLQGALRFGILQSDFSSYYEQSADQVAYDYDSTYLALSLKGSYDLPLSESFSLSPQLRYDLIYLGAEGLTLEHKDRNQLHMDDMTLQSLRANLQANWQLSEQLTLSLSGYVRRIFSSTFTGNIEGYTLPSYELSGNSFGLTLGILGKLGALSYRALLRQSWDEVEETSGQVQLWWRF